MSRLNRQDRFQERITTAREQETLKNCLQWSIRSTKSGSHFHTKSDDLFIQRRRRRMMKEALGQLLLTYLALLITPLKECFTWQEELTQDTQSRKQSEQATLTCLRRIRLQGHTWRTTHSRAVFHGTSLPSTNGKEASTALFAQSTLQVSLLTLAWGRDFRKDHRKKVW